MSKQQSAIIDERYADKIIDGHPEHFDAIEIQGVRHTAGVASDIVVDNDNPEYFSVYLHYIPDEAAGRVGVECVGDFTSLDTARTYAAILNTTYQWPICDFTNVPVSAE